MTRPLPKPGPELDALVAERVMGWHPWTNFLEGDYEGPMPMFCHHATHVDVYEDEESGDVTRSHWSPSTHIAAAWEVREKIAELGKGEMLIARAFKGWDAYQATGCADPDFGDWWARGDTAPHAICLAALRAVGALDDG